MEKKQQYLCVIGDLIESKKIRDRVAFQSKLKKAIRRINKRGHPVSPWTLTLGDEFQAVFACEEGIWDDILSMMAAVWPTRIRFSLATGSLSTSVNHRQALAMDGPAFHVARANIETLKRKGGLIRLGYERPPENAEWLTLFASLIGKILYQARNDSRFKVFRGLLAGRPRKEIAKEGKISPSAVSQQIETGALEYLVEGARKIEDDWRKLLTTG